MPQKGYATARRLRRSRTARLTSLSIAAALASLPVVATQAAAMPTDRGSCWDNDKEFWFDSTWVGVPSYKSSATATGIETLDDPLEHNGSDHVVTLVEVSNFTDVRVTAVDWGPNGSYGSSNCVNQIKINISPGSPWEAEAGYYAVVARHEMAHMLGLEHTNSTDSYDGLNPSTMASCEPPYENFSRDDIASLMAIGEGSDLSGWRYIGANPSFESGGTSHWGVANGTKASSAVGAQGGHSARLTYDSGGTTSMWQTVSVVDGKDYPKYIADAYARVVGSGSVSFKVQLLLQPVDWSDSGNSCDDEYPDGMTGSNTPDIASPTDVLDVYAEGAYTTVGAGSWTYVQTPQVKPPNVEGYRVQVRVLANLGKGQSIDVDGVDRYVADVDW